MTRSRSPSRARAFRRRTPSLGGELYRRILEELRRRIEASPGGHLVDGRLEELDLRLRLDLADAEAGAEAAGAELEAVLDGYVRDVVETAAAFRPGHAFCHRCETADCEHALPAGPRQAFAGYTPTGMPRWLDFGQLCLDRHHPEVDRLYQERPAVLTLEMTGADLKADLLPEFHRSARRHDLAGQVCAGLFRGPGLSGGEGGLAITLQAVITATRRGGRRVGLNLIGGGAALASAAPRDKPWRSAALWGQARFTEISRRAASGRMPAEAFHRRVAGVLGGIARRIERDLRGRGRRTRHAEERHLSGARPTRKAVDDLRSAGGESVLVDARHATLVVLGDRGRTHFFAPGGRLVSSVKYPPEAITKKIRTGRWRPATAEESSGLRSRVEETTGSAAGREEGDR